MRRERRRLAEKIADGARRLVAAAAAIAASAPLMAGYAPSSVKTAFAALYPDIETNSVIWSNTDDGYYLAQFSNDGLATRAWFNGQSQCVMVQTDLVTMDRVPDEVYNAFAGGSYADYTVLDVTYVVFPQWQPIYVVLAGLPNLEESYQLFYSPNGELLKERSTMGLNDLLGAETFIE
jgi:hypothetical protein